jgi:hypothetical protein
LDFLKPLVLVICSKNLKPIQFKTRSNSISITLN